MSQFGTHGGSVPSPGPLEGTDPPDCDARLGPSRVFNAAAIREPRLGDRIGPFRLHAQTGTALHLRVRSWVAALVVLGSTLLLLVLLAGIGLSIRDLIHGESVHIHGVVGLFLLLAIGGIAGGLSQIGLRYTFDRLTIRRTRLIGKPREWNAREVNHVRLFVVPYIKPYNEKLAVVLIGHDGKDIDGSEVVLIQNGQHVSHGDFGGGIQTRFREGAAAARIAAAIARVLNVPIRIQGTSERGTAEFRNLMEGRDI
jgi:hypothetical protein